MKRGNRLVKKRRSEIHIIAEILNMSKNGAKKTEILYQSNMSFSQLQDYLSHLIENDLLEEKITTNGNRANSKIYINTKKGNDLLVDITKTLSYFK